jgi:hypothetical protein
MAGGITVTGIPAMVAGGEAAGTLTVLERAGASGQLLVGFGSATRPAPALEFAPGFNAHEVRAGILS